VALGLTGYKKGGARGNEAGERVTGGPSWARLARIIHGCRRFWRFLVDLGARIGTFASTGHAVASPAFAQSRDFESVCGLMGWVCVWSLAPACSGDEARYAFQDEAKDFLRRA
jgi:hypothetical protein